MGMHYLNKVVMLDETDLVDFDDVETAEDLSELADYLAPHIWDEYFDDDQILIDVLGIASERFGVFIEVNPNDCNHLYLQKDWDSSLANCCRFFGGCDPHLLNIANSGKPITQKVDAIKECIITAVNNSEMHKVRSLSYALESVEGGRSPGFKDDQPSIGGDDEACDMRRSNHGPGKRLLVEFAVTR